jgi:predicted transcriptional regulator
VLGVRLTPEIENRMTRFARSTGRPKSDVARAAIVEYLDRHTDELEFERQLQAAAEMERHNDASRQEIDELDALAWQLTNDLD